MNCQSCGACCSHYKIIPVYDDELLAIPRRMTVLRRGQDAEPICDRLNANKEIEETYRKMIFINGSFWAFSGKIGENCSCTIYQHRPSVCRDYPNNGRSCLKVRFEYNIVSENCRETISKILNYRNPNTKTFEEAFNNDYAC